MALANGKVGGMNGHDVAEDANRGPVRALDDVSRRSQGRAHPAALAVEDAARLLSAAGGQRITAEMIAADVAAGAPTNADGTINLVHYAAWLTREMATGGD